MAWLPSLKHGCTTIVPSFSIITIRKRPTSYVFTRQLIRHYQRWRCCIKWCYARKSPTLCSRTHRSASALSEYRAVNVLYSWSICVKIAFHATGSASSDASAILNNSPSTRATPELGWHFAIAIFNLASSINCSFVNSVIFHYRHFGRPPDVLRVQKSLRLRIKFYLQC